MGRTDELIVNQKPCKCGCGKQVQIRKRHLFPSHSMPNYIKGHQQFGNKRGYKNGMAKCNGYNLIYCPEHPNANSMGKGYVRYSRYLMEQSLNRYLESHEVIHHINGIKDDDRIENLVLTNKSEHRTQYHKYQYKLFKKGTDGKFIKK